MLWLRPKALMTYFLRDLVPTAAFNSRLIKQLELVLGNYGFSLKLSSVLDPVKSWGSRHPKP